MHTNCEPPLITILRVLLAFFHLFDSFNGLRYAPTGYVWAGVDSACEQRKLKATRTRNACKPRRISQVRCALSWAHLGGGTLFFFG